MAQRLRRFSTPDDAHTALERVRHAVKLLKAASLELRLAGAVRTHKRANAALKSAEGAVRHAERSYSGLDYDARREDGTA